MSVDMDGWVDIVLCVPHRRSVSRGKGYVNSSIGKGGFW